MNFENILSLIVYFLIIITITFVIYKKNDIKVTKKILISYVIILCVFSYLYKPLTPVDLTRLQDTLPNLKSMSFKTMLSNLPHTTDYMRLIYFWIVSKIGDKNLLQLIATLIYYSCSFYIIYDYCKSNNIKNKVLSIVVCYFMLFGQFIFVICGLRTAIAFSLFALCYYRECFKNKSFLSNIFIYAVMLGMHTSIIPVFIVRIFILLFEKKDKNKVLNIITILIIALILIVFGKGLVTTIFDKIKEYLNMNYYNKAEYLTSFFELLMFGILLLYNYKNKKNNEIEKIKKYRIFVMIVYGACIIFCFQYTIFTRYVRLTEIMILPILASEWCLIESEYKESKKVPKYKIIFDIILLMSIGVSFGFANMSQYNIF